MPSPNELIQLRTQQLQDLAKQQPNSGAAFQQLGEILMTQGRSKEAVEAFGRAVVLDPNHFASRINLGALLKGCDRWIGRGTHALRSIDF